MDPWKTINNFLATATCAAQWYFILWPMWDQRGYFLIHFKAKLQYNWYDCSVIYYLQCMSFPLYHTNSSGFLKCLPWYWTTRACSIQAFWKPVTATVGTVAWGNHTCLRVPCLTYYGRLNMKALVMAFSLDC